MTTPAPTFEIDPKKVFDAATKDFLQSTGLKKVAGIDIEKLSSDAEAIYNAAQGIAAAMLLPPPASYAAMLSTVMATIPAVSKAASDFAKFVGWEDREWERPRDRGFDALKDCASLIDPALFPTGTRSTSPTPVRAWSDGRTSAATFDTSVPLFPDSETDYQRAWSSSRANDAWRLWAAVFWRLRELVPALAGQNEKHGRRLCFGNNATPAFRSPDFVWSDGSAGKLSGYRAVAEGDVSLSNRYLASLPSVYALRDALSVQDPSTRRFIVAQLLRGYLGAWAHEGVAPAITTHEFWSSPTAARHDALVSGGFALLANAPSVCSVHLPSEVLARFKASPPRLPSPIQIARASRPLDPLWWSAAELADVGAMPTPLRASVPAGAEVLVLWQGRSVTRDGRPVFEARLGRPPTGQVGRVTWGREWRSTGALGNPDAGSGILDFDRARVFVAADGGDRDRISDVIRLWGGFGAAPFRFVAHPSTVELAGTPLVPGMTADADTQKGGSLFPWAIAAGIAWKVLA